MKKAPFKNYGFAYEYEGSSFVFHIVASSADEARGRAKAMSDATFEGELKEAPAPDEQQKTASRAVGRSGMEQSQKAQEFLANLDPESLKVGDGSDGLPVWIGVDAEAQRVYKVYASGLAQGFGDGRMVIINGLQAGCGWRAAKAGQSLNIPLSSLVALSSLPPVSEIAQALAPSQSACATAQTASRAGPVGRAVAFLRRVFRVR